MDLLLSIVMCHYYLNFSKNSGMHRIVYFSCAQVNGLNLKVALVYLDKLLLHVHIVN